VGFGCGVDDLQVVIIDEDASSEGDGTVDAPPDDRGQDGNADGTLLDDGMPEPDGGVDMGTDAGADMGGDVGPDTGADVVADRKPDVIPIDAPSDVGPIDAPPDGPPDTDPTPAAVAAGSRHACLLSRGGRVYCWGENAKGQLGDGTNAPHSVPLQVPGLVGVTAISSGKGEHTCALTSDGAVLCWGSNANGQLGDGTNTDRNVPTLVSRLGRIRAIGVGGAHSCAIDPSGAATCWGSNAWGQVGDGTSSPGNCGACRNKPVNVLGLAGATAIAGSADTVASQDAGHTCAIAGGQLYCWGLNNYGQIGDGSGVSQSRPVLVSNPMMGPVEAVAVGGQHTCAIAGGKLYCWGYDFYGQLGDGMQTPQHTPVQVINIGPAAQVAAGTFSTCSILVGDVTVCFGQNGSGQVGDGTTTDRSSPAVVSFVPSKSPTWIATGGDFQDPGHATSSYAIVGNHLFAWGSNAWGQIGDGTTMNRLSPTAIPGF
jgi:alpha-tubulin suppressor-like RCC1 family protein